MRKNKTNILMIAPINMGYGGVQNVIMQLVRELGVDECHFDVVVFEEEEGCHESELLQYGRIFRIPCSNKAVGIKGVCKDLYYDYLIYKNLIQICNKYGPYSVLHCQYLFKAAPCLKAAEKVGIPIRIAHSHTECPDSLSVGRKMINRVQRHILNRYATVRIGVTKGACEYLFGKKKNYSVIKNPVIDLNKFNPSKSPDVVGELTLIQVGHFGPRKNEFFSIDVVAYIRRYYPRVKLRFVGFSNTHPDYLNQMKRKIYEYEIQDNVEFLPPDTDMPVALADSLYMLIPSLSEGLPIVALEAQAMGVHCFISTNVSRETDQGLASFLSLEKGAEYWADSILAFYKKNGNKKRFIDMSNYDHKKVCEEYLRIYREGM